MKKAHVLLFDGYADWEIGNALAEIRRLGNKEVVSVGFNRDSVCSMGGLQVLPDMAMTDIDIDAILIFILPGGQLWEGDYPIEVIGELLNLLDKRTVPIAAICAATTVVARAGILSGRRHTSNSIKYMAKMVPGYNSHDSYVDALAVRDRHLITASGLGSVDFTMQILKELKLVNADLRKLWYDAFKSGIYPDVESK